MPERDSKPMSDTATVCSHCGETVPVSEGVAGFCLDCLLGAGLEPAVLHPSYQYDHYEVLLDNNGDPIELGHGAMGITYRAIDTTLKSEVALKVIDPAYTNHEIARQRFNREAQTAFKVRHPNIAGVLYAGTRADNQCFYAMELVPGETLAARVRRAGPLPVTMALEIALQVTRALTATEQKGFVHRDLKPGNLMLTGSDSEVMVKLIDFGLAKAVASGEAETSLTRDAFIGTPAFASPEHYNLEPIDSRSDFFSLGATLWYTLCGKPPFSGRNFEEIQQAQAKGILPLGDLRARRVPGPVVELLRSLLQGDPERRPQTAQELQNQLQACQRGLTARSLNKWRSRILFSAIAILILGVAAGLLAFFGQSHRQPSAGKSLAVLPFESLNKNEETSYLVDGIQDEILTDLAKLSELKVIGRNSVQSYRDPANRPRTQEIAKALGVDYLLEGSVIKAGDRLRVSARLISGSDDREVWGEHYEGNRDELFRMQIDLAQQIANELRIQLSTTERKETHKSPTNDFAAYELYLRAKELYYKYDEYVGDAQQKLNDAVLLLKEAIQRDPQFSDAWRLLAEVDGAIVNFGYDRSPTRQRDAKEALEQAAKLDPTAPENHLIRALLSARLDRNYEQATVEVKTALESLPNNSLGYLISGVLAWIQGRYQSVEPNLLRAYELDPRYTATISELMYWYGSTRQYDAKAKLIDRVLAAGVHSDRLDIDKAELLLEARADTAPLRTCLSNLPKTGNAASRLTLARYELALLDRNYNEAYSVLVEDGREIYQGDGVGVKYPRAFLEGVIARAAGDHPRSVELFQKSLPIVQKQVNDDPNDATALYLLASIQANLGQKEIAIAEAKQVNELRPLAKNYHSHVFFQRYLALIYAWAGEKDLAIQTLQTLAKIPFSEVDYGQMKLDPEWDDLRGDQRFTQIIKDLAPPDLK